LKSVGLIILSVDEPESKQGISQGAGGFSGSHLVARLIGAWVRAPAHYNFG
jgi:hypothetical protein